MKNFVTQVAAILTMPLILSSCQTITLSDTETCFLNVAENRIRCHTRSYDIRSPDAGNRISPSYNINGFEHVDRWVCVEPEWFAGEVVPALKYYSRRYQDR